MAKKSYRVKGVSYKFKYTHAQRAAYWKKKYLKCASDLRQRRMGG